jgi:hypothetical protein
VRRRSRVTVTSVNVNPAERRSQSVWRGSPSSAAGLTPIIGWADRSPRDDGEEEIMPLNWDQIEDERYEARAVRSADNQDIFTVVYNPKEKGWRSYVNDAPILTDGEVTLYQSSDEAMAGCERADLQIKRGRKTTQFSAFGTVD